MKPLCAELQDRMADEGLTVFQDDTQAMDHVGTCDTCSAVMHELEGLDVLLGDLPIVDAPDTVVEMLMQRPELQEPPRTGFLADLQQRFQGWSASRPWASAWRPVSAMAALLLVTTVSWQLFTGDGMLTAPEQMAEFQTVSVQTATQDAPEDEPASIEEVEDMLPPTAVDTNSDLQETAGGRALDERKQSKTSLRALGYIGDESGKTANEQMNSNLPQEAKQDGDTAVRSPAPAKPKRSNQPPPPPGWRRDDGQDVYGETITVTGEAITAPVVSSAVSYGVDPNVLEDQAEMDLVFGIPDAAPVDPSSGFSDSHLGIAKDGLKGERAAGERAEKVVSEDEAYGGVETAPLRQVEKEPNEADLPSDPQAARRFLEARDLTEGIAFQSATGYWRNTYVPGDSELRHLAARLGKAAELGDGAVQAPHLLAHTLRQPFDVPDNAALAVYLSADHRAVDGRQRMLVQVGLQGTERHGGRRGAMRLTVVLDLTDEEIGTEALQGMSALLAALANAKEPGDQFRLVVAGRGGGEVVGADGFRHGPLTLALQEAVESADDPSLPWFSLEEAHRKAVLTASGAMDPEAPLGSSLVLLVLPDWVRNTPRHEHIAHRGALEGVRTSTVSVGSDLDLEELDFIVLAGQGHRRLLHRPSDAEGIVERELQSVSRVIARAVRLRIRLAPGVHLVDVLGSERLDTAAAQRVRDAESHVDRQLSKRLGIAADRGEDEEGLQIVIPSFYTGDSHVVLLDVVTDGAGPIADVRVRYKDLVHLENGVARARLDVPRGRDAAPGPLQRNVLENLMAQELRGTLMEAADLVSIDQKELAADLLRRFEELLRGLGAHVPGWSGDQDVERDLRLLSHARRFLRTASGEQMGILYDSMRYSGYLKTLPPPEEDGADVHSEPPSE